MKNNVQKILITVLGSVLNVLGGMLADYLQLPIRFDVTGTFVAAYFAGLWGGMAACVCGSLHGSSFVISDLAYLSVGLIIVLVIHVFVRRKYFDTIIRAVISAFWLGIICTIVYTPLNLLFFDGYTKNIWGDTLVDMLKWYNTGKVVPALAGEAVVEIIDKQLCMLAAYPVIFLLKKLPGNKKSMGRALSVVLLAGITTMSLLAPVRTSAEETETDRNNIVAKIYNNTNGMVSSEANTICETDDGYIWIGSYAGLTRYDGQRFEFIREGGLVNVVSMMVDSRGRLWIGTNDAGIARYENGRYTYFTVKDGLPSDSVRCFAEDGEGNVYVGTSDRICKLDINDSVEILNYGISFAKYMAICNGYLIVLDNNGGLYALDGQNVRALSNAYGSYFYYCLADTSDGLMVGTETGELFVLDCSAEGFTVRNNIEIDTSCVCTLFEDSRNRIWVGLDLGFGYIETDGTFHKMYYNDFPSSVVCFHEDYQGNIWAASSDYGVMKLSESPFYNLFDNSDTEGRVVNAVVLYDGDYYCGTDDGLIILDGADYSTKTSGLTKKTAGYRVRSLFVDSSNQLWVCAYNGLWCYRNDGSIRGYNTTNDRTTSDRFRCITELEDGTIVSGTADGINYIRDGEVAETLTAQNGLGNTQILSIVEGWDGNVWAGSDGSGIYVISGNRLVRNYTVGDGLSSNIILRIIPCNKGYMIVTSNSLCHIDEAGTVKKLTSFPYFNNYDIMLKDGEAFVTCSAGLYKVKLSELCNDNIGQPVLYSAAHGLLSGLTANSWNYIGSDGQMFLCANNGVIVFDEEMTEASPNLKFGVCSVECNGNVLEPNGTGTYVAPEGAGSISINASVRNYAFSDVKVRFFVQELEDNPDIMDWDEVQPIQLQKSDFSSYHICLQILDNSGTKVLREKIYILEKEMHPWDEPIFKIYFWSACVEIFLFAVFNIVCLVLYVIRKNELEQNKVELEKRVFEQTRELSLQQKKIKDIFTRTVTALSEAVDAKDRYTSGHSKRVAEYAFMIAGRLGKDRDEQELIYRAGLLHDVGKIRVPAEIINKPGRLTEEEYNTIKIHPMTGYHILRGISDDNSIAIGAKYHHERYDGKGYPNGLAGEKIPEIARILAVADAYDAMASNRSYRNVLPQEVVRSEIENGRGTQFDPKIADIMLEMIDEDKAYDMRQSDTTQKYILTVDNEEENNRVIENIMQDEAMYNVVSATSGREALQIMQHQKFDLILLDVCMKDMESVEIVRLIKESYRTPVVLITADKAFDNSKEFEAHGCNDYITKPVFPLLIKEVIHNMTERYTDKTD